MPGAQRAQWLRAGRPHAELRIDGIMTGHMPRRPHCRPWATERVMDRSWPATARRARGTPQALCRVGRSGPRRLASCAYEYSWPCVLAALPLPSRLTICHAQSHKCAGAVHHTRAHGTARHEHERSKYHTLPQRSSAMVPLTALEHATDTTAYAALSDQRGGSARPPVSATIQAAAGGHQSIRSPAAGDHQRCFYATRRRRPHW